MGKHCRIIYKYERCKSFVFGNFQAKGTSNAHKSQQDSIKTCWQWADGARLWQPDVLSCLGQHLSKYGGLTAYCQLLHHWKPPPPHNAKSLQSIRKVFPSTSQRTNHQGNHSGRKGVILDFFSATFLSMLSSNGTLLSMLHAIWEPAQSADCMGLSMQSADCMVTVQTKDPSKTCDSFSKFQRNLRFSARINFLTKLPYLKENNLCLFDNGYYSFSCL